MKSYKRKDDITTAKLDDLFTLFVVKKGTYLNLNSTSSMIWEFLESKLTFKDLKKRILDIYDVDNDTLENDLEFFLNEAEKLDIIDIYE